MDRVNLVRAYDKQSLRSWRQGGVQQHSTTVVTFGRLADGRWWAERTGYEADVDDRRQGACVFGADDQAEQLALRLAYSWMREGEWRPQPAAFDAYGKPVDGLSWVRRGADWFLHG